MRYLLFLFLVFLTNIIYTQEKTNKNNDSININKYLKEVVITGQLSELASEEAVHDINIINAKVINSGIFSSLTDILKYQNNIQISNDNILGSRINIQGISGENIKILIDGVPVIGRLDGNIDVSQINLNNVERIEIVEGPMSVNFGSDALAGTINIITKKADKKNIDQFFNSYYESVGKYNNSILLNHKYKNQSVSNLFTRNYFSGWSKEDEFSFFPKKQLADTNRFKKWKPKEQMSNKIEHSIKLKSISILSYHEYFYEKITNRGMPQESSSFATAFDDDYYTFRNNIGTSVSTNINNHIVKSNIAYNQYKRIKNTFLKNLTNLSESLLNNPGSQDTSYFNMLMFKSTVTNEAKQKINYQIGVDIHEQYARGKRILENEQKQKNYALFSNIEWRPTNKIVFRPGVRFIHNDKYTAPIIPAGNLLYKINDLSFRVSYARGFRAPSLKELFFEFIDINHNIVGNPNLSAEESDNYRFSTSIEKETKKLKFSTIVSAFYNNIENKISLSNINSQYSYFNIEKHKTQGISMKIKMSSHNVIFDNGISYTGKYNNLSEDNNVNSFNYSFDYKSNVILNISAKTTLNIFYKYNGVEPTFTFDENDEIIETKTEDYHLLDLSINKKILKEKVELTIGCKNIINVTEIKASSENTIHSSNYNSIPIGYGRTLFTRLNIKL